MFPRHLKGGVSVLFRRRPARAWVAILATVAIAVLASAASAKTVWLCRPGQQPDPCTPGLSTTVYSPSLTEQGAIHPRPIRNPPIDCFYVYPTVSGQQTGNANLHVDPEERDIATFQAARYAQYCRVYAPMYRQVTLAGIGLGSTPTTAPNPALASADVRNAFNTYLRKYNHGRGFVLIGHSQGTFVLRQLIASEIDPNPTLRARLVSAILLGDNVLVKRGKTRGSDFINIPACRSATQLGCVIAFSTYDQAPPSDSIFGRSTSPKQQVLCTNPAALGGGSGLLNPIAPSAPFAPGTIWSSALEFESPHPPTVWWTTPGAYRAECETANGATVLEIEPLSGAPTPTPLPIPSWGLHLLDANIALGNLITIVKSQASAYKARHR